MIIAVLANGGSATAAHAEVDAKNSADPTTSEKAVCARSFEQAQRLQRDSKYIAATQELLGCANPTCGDALFRECSRMYKEFQEAIPTLVFSARDAQSDGDRSDVAVSVDGQEVLQQLQGRAVLVDPGTHHVVFKAPGRASVERDYIVRAGEKFRQISVVFELPHAEHAAPVLPPSNTSTRPVPTGSYVLAGVGLAALGGFAALRVIGGHDYDSLDRTCAPECAQSELARVRREYLISDIAAGVGGVALASAVVVFLTAPRNSQSAALQVAPNLGSLSARLVVRF